MENENKTREDCMHCDTCKTGVCCAGCGKDNKCGGKCWCGRSNCSCGKWCAIIIALVIGLLVGGWAGRAHSKRYLDDRAYIDGINTLSETSVEESNGVLEDK